MTDNNLSFTPESIFQQVIARGREQGVTDLGTYNDLVEEVIEEHRAVGEISNDDAIEDLVDQTQGRWPDYQAALEETTG